MLAATRRLIEQLAERDEREGVWDVFIPLPSMVKTTLEGDVNLFDVAMEIDEILDGWEGVTYSTVGAGNGEVWVAGIAL